jgi:hypothetical protein
MTSLKQILSRTGLLEPAKRARNAAKRARNAAERAAALTLHPVREALVRLPDPWFLVSQRGALDERYRGHLEELKREGITRVSGEVPAEILAELRRAFAQFIARLDAGGRSAATYQGGDITLTDEYFDADSRQYSSNEPFAFSRALLEICLKPQLVALINAYLGKNAYITQGVAFRIDPNPRTGFGSFQWHHDAWGKRINMMIVLTEVGEGDQHMTYAKGSHLLRHPYDKYVNSRYSREEFAARCGHLEVLNCYAKSGDIYIFDSNGLHSGNRSAGRARDVFILEYTRLSNTIWAHNIPAEFLAGFDEQQLRPLQWILRQDRRARPLAPPVNSWVDNVLRPDRWSF